MTSKKTKIILPKHLEEKPKPTGQWLVSWKDMQKNSEEPLPMRPFPDRDLAEAYITGCADVIQIVSKNPTDYHEIIRDFEITCVEGN
jgi:hypothetical protein